MPDGKTITVTSDQSCSQACRALPLTPAAEFPMYIIFLWNYKERDARYKYGVLIDVSTSIKWTWNFERYFFLSWQANALSRGGLRFLPHLSGGVHNETNECSQHCPDLVLMQTIKKPQWASSICFFEAIQESSVGAKHLISLNGRKRKLNMPGICWGVENMHLTQTTSPEPDMKIHPVFCFYRDVSRVAELCKWQQSCRSTFS